MIEQKYKQFLFMTINLISLFIILFGKSHVPGIPADLRKSKKSVL